MFFEAYKAKDHLYVDTAKHIVALCEDESQIDDTTLYN